MKTFINLCYVAAFFLLTVLLAGCSKNDTVNTTATTTTTPVIDKGILVYPLTTGSWWLYHYSYYHIIPGGPPILYDSADVKITIEATRLLPNGKTVAVWQFDQSKKTSSGTNTTSYEKYGLSNGNFITVYGDTALIYSDLFFSYNSPLTVGSVFIETDVFRNSFMDTLRVTKPGSITVNGKTYDGAYNMARLFLVQDYGTLGLTYYDYQYSVDIVPGLGNIRMSYNQPKYREAYSGSAVLMDYHIQ